jgi:hypothetical protein
MEGVAELLEEIDSNKHQQQLDSNVTDVEEVEHTPACFLCNSATFQQTGMCT